MVKKFEAHYHGIPIAVGKHFNVGDVHASALMESGEWKDLSIRDFFIPDTSPIQYAGNNVYEAYYMHNGIKYTNYFTVLGYTNKDTINPDFKLFVVHDNLHEEDITEISQFLFYDSIFEKIYITINKIDKALSNGKYRLIAPKNSGMHCKYATEWTIIKENGNITMFINKIYDEEEIKNGKEEESGTATS